MESHFKIKSKIVVLLPATQYPKEGIYLTGLLCIEITGKQKPRPQAYIN
jgi:hypothetical protein